MRAVTPEELELIVGAGNHTATLTPIPVTGTPPAPPPAPSPPPGGGGGPPTYPPPPPCPSPLPLVPRDDQQYVYRNEGVQLSLTGYTLPQPKYKNSGVTIGFGVDLGQHSVAELTAWGMSSAGITAVSPFIGLKGASAVNAVANSGAPTISAADAQLISDAAYEQIVTQAAARFDIGSSVPFDSLPTSAQTVIADIAYNSGPAGAPAFFNDVMAGNWAAAIYELNNFYGPGQTLPRFQADAQLLQASINNGELAPDGTCIK